MRLGNWEIDPLWLVVAAAICVATPFNDIHGHSVVGELIATTCVVVIAVCVFFIDRRRRR